MNINDAYRLIGVEKNISDDELKAKYKKLAKEFHPDIYKGDDKDKFKSINEAYQLIQDHRQNPQKYEQSANPFIGFDLNDIFSGFNTTPHKQRQYQQPDIQLNVQLTFKESVLGAEKQLIFKKMIKCQDCDGQGVEYQNNGCKHCNGFGRVVARQGGMVYTSTCNKCNGKNIQSIECKKCSSYGILETEANITVHIPAGTPDKSILRLPGGGHYVGSNGFFGDANKDAYVHVRVEKDIELTLQGQDVISHLQISLLEALTGCQKEVKTIHGQKTIDLPILTKNKDEIKIAGCGVKNSNGAQKVIVEIKYPDDVNDLIEVLKK